MSATPTPELQALRERIKLAIQTAQDSEGRLLYVIPPGVAGMYADSVMRVLTLEPYPYGSGVMSDPEHADWCHVVIGCIAPNHCTCETDLFGFNPPISGSSDE